VSNLQWKTFFISVALAPIVAVAIIPEQVHPDFEQKIVSLPDKYKALDNAED
jgi:hypothetical protein